MTTNDLAEVSALKSSEYGYYKTLKLDMIILPCSTIINKTDWVNPQLQKG